jgi:hypothetical protein
VSRVAIETDRDLLSATFRFGIHGRIEFGVGEQEELIIGERMVTFLQIRPPQKKRTSEMNINKERKYRKRRRRETTYEANEALGMEEFIERIDEVISDGGLTRKAFRPMESDVAFLAIRITIKEHERFRLIDLGHPITIGVRKRRDSGLFFQAFGVDERVPTFRTEQMQLVVMTRAVFETGVVQTDVRILVDRGVTMVTLQTKQLDKPRSPIDKARIRLTATSGWKEKREEEEDKLTSS